MPTISAVVITYNQAHKLEPTLKALQKVTKDIVVIDAFSTDDTQEICTKLQVRFYQRTWDGYSTQKNYGNSLAANNWILSIDSDEVVSDELINNIKEIESIKVDYSAFYLPFRTIFCGKMLHYGAGNPEAHIRLFNKNVIQWNTSGVHEGLTIDPEHRVGTLKGYVYHYTVDTLPEFYAKNEKYSSLFALSRKNNTQPNYILMYTSPFFRFVKEYILKLGFLDGKYGWIIAKENAYYTYLKYKKISTISQ